MRPGGVLVALLLSISAGAACGPRRSANDAAAGGPPTAEARFGNDGPLVARFTALGACAFRDGRLDHGCPQLQALRQTLARGREETERRPRMTTTLRNLLESRNELHRLVAAESLFDDHRDAGVRAAMRLALQRETASAVSAALLRQLCWEPDGETLRAALGHLRAGGPEPLQLEAITCLGRSQTSPEGVVQLRQTLRQSTSPTLRGALCTALAEAGARSATPEVSAALDAAGADGRCAMALSALGGEQAYRALRRATAASLERGHAAAQSVTALLTFRGEPYFERDQVLALLVRQVSAPRASWTSRLRAVAGLGTLGGRVELHGLRARFPGADELAEGDRQVIAAIDRTLARD